MRNEKLQSTEAIVVFAVLEHLALRRE